MGREQWGERFTGTTKRTHGQNQGGGWRRGWEVSSAGVGWRDGEKRQTTVTEKQ